MTFYRLVVLPICWVLVSAAEDATSGGSTGSTAAPSAAQTLPAPDNSTHSGGKSPGGGKAFNGLNVDSSMIQRALYVLIGITVTGVLYFLIRAVRLKRPTNKKKYGLLSNHDDSVEMMAAADSDDDDTLYEARSLRR